MTTIIKKEKSENLILNCFKGNKALTKTDIQKLTGLSYATVFSVRVPDLIKQGKLVVVDKVGSNVYLKLGVV